MTPLLLRTIVFTEASLSLAEATEQFSDMLPLFDNHAIQALLVIAVPLLFYELSDLAAQAIKRLKAWWRRQGAA